MHGTNAGITVQNGGRDVYAQSRNKFLSDKKSNYGFYGKFVKENEKYFSSLWQQSKAKKHLTFFGEFCGKGIMKNAAISEIEKNIFCVFAVQIDDHLIVEPQLIQNYLKFPLPQNMYLLPWQTCSFFFDFSNLESLASQAQTINNIVNEIDKKGDSFSFFSSIFLKKFQDPWVEKEFGKLGVGEGLGNEFQDLILNFFHF